MNLWKINSSISKPFRLFYKWIKIFLFLKNRIIKFQEDEILVLKYFVYKMHKILYMIESIVIIILYLYHHFEKNKMKILKKQEI